MICSYTYIWFDFYGKCRQINHDHGPGEMEIAFNPIRFKQQFEYEECMDIIVIIDLHSVLHLISGITRWNHLMIMLDWRREVDGAR